MLSEELLQLANISMSIIVSVYLYAHRKYFKARSNHMSSDDVIIDKFEVHELSTRIQFDPFGIFSLKV